MDFKKQKPIYLQMADSICEHIIADEWNEDERIPSVRELATQLGVNPNTTMRIYEYLQNADIIYNRRGLGYFVSPKAKDVIAAQNRLRFVREELPILLQHMKVLGISWAEVEQMYAEQDGQESIPRP